MISNSGSGAWFDARKASTCSAQGGGAVGYDGCGGETAERWDDAAARVTNSGEVTEGDGGARDRNKRHMTAPYLLA
jgi:hypothetical protein